MAETKTETVKPSVTVEFVRPGRDLVDHKGITRQDWKGIDVTHADVWFNAGNQYKVDGSDFPKEVLDYFKSDPDFKVTEGDKA